MERKDSTSKDSKLVSKSGEMKGDENRVDIYVREGLSGPSECISAATIARAKTCGRTIAL